MEPLVFNRRQMMWLSFCSPDKITSRFKKRAFIACFLIVITSLISSLIGSVAFLARFMLCDLEQTLQVLFQISCSAITLYISVVAYFSQHKLDRIFVGLSRLYEICKTNFSYIQNTTRVIC